MNKIHTMTKKYDIRWSEVLDSTNEEAKRRISDLDNLSVLSVSKQTAGRGQRGNSWTAEPGQNLTFSIVLKFRTDGTSSDCKSDLLPPLKAAEQFVLCELTSLSVVELLRNHGIISSVKWPNDIYVNSRKVCGMLIENTLRGLCISSSIIGIGLNVNQRNFDVSLPNPTSLALEARKQFCFEDSFPVFCNKSAQSVTFSEDEPPKFDLNLLLTEFMDIFIRNVRLYLCGRTNGHPGLRESYLPHLWRLDEKARFIDYTTLPSGHADNPIVAGRCDETGREFTGTIRGLSPVGHLVIEDHDTAALREFSFKEIGYIL